LQSQINASFRSQVCGIFALNDPAEFYWAEVNDRPARCIHQSTHDHLRSILPHIYMMSRQGIDEKVLLAGRTLTDTVGYHSATKPPDSL
jgi:hypothetical protein